MKMIGGFIEENCKDLGSLMMEDIFVILIVTNRSHSYRYLNMKLLTIILTHIFSGVIIRLFVEKLHSREGALRRKARRTQ